MPGHTSSIYGYYQKTSLHHVLTFFFLYFIADFNTSEVTMLVFDLL